MADEKKKKKKKKEDADTSTEPEAPPSTPASSRPASKKAPSGGSKKAKRGGSNVFDQFTEKQVAEFKEGFQFMDKDKDGIIGKSDIRQTCDDLGRMVTEDDLDQMIQDAPGPINFTMLINMFGQRQTGGAADEDDVVIDAWKAFSDENGMIDVDKFKFDITHFGDRYTEQEVADFLEQLEVNEDGKVDCATICDMMCGKTGGEDE